MLKRLFGTTKNGESVYEYTLKNKDGASVKILSYGCTLRSIEVFDKEKNLIDVCLGYDTIEEYEKNRAYLGALIGRFANRIGEGKFILNGEIYNLAVNNGPNHIHGGIRGFDKYVYSCEERKNSVRLFRISPDGEEGYPGNLKVSVEYIFTDRNELFIHYEAESDKDTVLNLTNHCYFNLNGHDSGTNMNHVLELSAEEITANDEDHLPDGKIINVSQTPFDFRIAKTIGRDIGDGKGQVKGEYDNNYVIRTGGKLTKIATLRGDKSGIEMEVYTDRPGVQLYTPRTFGNMMGKGNAKYSETGAICLETQTYPNATKHKHFPSPILRKGERFVSDTVYKFK